MDLCAIAVAGLCLTACREQSWNSPLNRIPKPTEPTSTFEGYQPATVVVVPPFRRTIAGTVREAGGGPLADVEIDGPSDQDRERPKTVTAKDGSFRFEQTLYETLSFDKKGYHPAIWWLPRDAYLQEVQTVAIRMQPRIVASGANFSGVIVSEDVTFFGGYPFGDEGQSYECGPCKLIDIAPAEQGATLRLSWAGSTPLALWAGNTQSWDGPYIRAVSRADASELVGTTKSRIDAVLVGLDPSTHITPGEPIAFTLTVERF